MKHCQTCDQEFATASSRKRHEKVKHQHNAQSAQSAHRCQECNLSFVRKETLIRHTLSKHSREDLPRCSFCQRRLRVDYFQHHTLSCVSKYLRKFTRAIATSPAIGDDLTRLTRSRNAGYDVQNWFALSSGRPLAHSPRITETQLRLISDFAFDIDIVCEALARMICESLEEKALDHFLEAHCMAWGLEIPLLSILPDLLEENRFSMEFEMNRSDLFDVHACFRAAEDAIADSLAVHKHNVYGGTVLHEACFYGLACLLEPLCWAGADFDRVDEDGQTPLSLAALGGHLDTVRFALALGADPNFCTPLLSAIDSGQRDVVRALRDHGADADPKVNGAMAEFMMRAIAAEDVEKVHFLLDTGLGSGYSFMFRVALCSGLTDIATLLEHHGADINDHDLDYLAPFETAVKTCGTEGVRIALSLGVNLKDGAPLQCALVTGKLEEAKVLVEFGADIDGVASYENSEVTPLQAAIRFGDIEAVRSALSLGADPNLGPTIHFALEHEKPDLVALLLDHGADLSKRDDNENTCLHIAVRKRNSYVLRSILDQGVSLDYIDACDNHGWTSLHMTAVYNFPEGAEMLLNAGASPEAATWTGLTTLQIAAMGGNAEVVQLLLERTPQHIMGQGTQVQSSTKAAVRGNHLEIVQILLDSEVYVDLDALLPDALERSSPKVLELLLKNGAHAATVPSDYVSRLRDTMKGKNPLSWENREFEAKISLLNDSLGETWPRMIRL